VLPLYFEAEQRRVLSSGDGAAFFEFFEEDQLASTVFVPVYGLSTYKIERGYNFHVLPLDSPVKGLCWIASKSCLLLYLRSNVLNVRQNVPTSLPRLAYKYTPGTLEWKQQADHLSEYALVQRSSYTVVLTTPTLMYVWQPQSEWHALFSKRHIFRLYGVHTDIFASIEAGSESSLACSLWRIQNDAAPKRIHSQNICALHSGGVANKYQVAVESSNGGVLCVLSPVERRAYSSVEPGHRPKGAFSNAVCSDVQLHILDVRHGRIEVRTRLLSGLTGSLNDLQRCSIFSTTSSVASSTETTGLMLRLSYVEDKTQCIEV